VGQLAKERKTLQERLTAQDAELKALEANMSEARTRIGHRLRRLYRFSKTSEAASLFTLVRFKTLFKDSQYLARLKREDEQAIAHIRELHESVTAKRKAVEESLIELALLTDELKGEQQTLSSRERRLRASLQEMRTNQGVYHAYLKDLEQVMSRMESAIATLEARGREAARRQAPADLNTLRGQLPPPVTGRVVAEFGKHDPRYQLKKFQRGMVIRTDQDAAPVKAIAPGQVVHAGPFRGYQDLVVLDHGGGMFSVYGHLSDLQVRRGTRIDGGTVLGTATYQPIDEGYSVYFEMRRAGKPVDPMTWINGTGLRPAAQG
jgi:septal ring factor EnvC (AmiA/AmiB activator)